MFFLVWKKQKVKIYAHLQERIEQPACQEYFGRQLVPTEVNVKIVLTFKKQVYIFLRATTNIFSKATFLVRVWNLSPELGTYI